MEGCSGCGRILEVKGTSPLSKYTMEFNGIRYVYCSGKCVNNHIQTMRRQAEEQENILSDTLCSKCNMYIKEKQLGLYKVIGKNFCYDCWSSMKDNNIEIDINDYKL